jgi:hypothetical protein
MFVTASAKVWIDRKSAQECNCIKPMYDGRIIEHERLSSLRNWGTRRLLEAKFAWSALISIPEVSIRNRF